MTRSALLLATLVAGLLACASTAAAGTYTVNVCGVGERQWGNGLLTKLQPADNVAVDPRCNGGDTYVGLTQKASTAMTDDTYADLGFQAPAGTTIADFTVRHKLTVKNSDTPGHNPYVIGVLGSTVFEGAGNDVGPRTTLEQQGLWAGGASNAGATGLVTRTGSQLASLSGYRGDASRLLFRLGCRKAGTVCDLDADGLAQVAIAGLSVTLNDATPPTVTPAATGLLASGAQPGSTPVSVMADDASGIKDLQLLDVTAPAAPKLVGAKSFDPGNPAAVTSARGQACTFNAVHACPALTMEPLVPTALPAGRRTLVVRAVDTAGNVADAGPYRVDVSTPSDRGAANGTNVTETAKLSAGFTTGRKGSRTVDPGARPTIKGRLVNAQGQPIGGARLVVYTRATNRSSYTRRGVVKTGAAGRYALKARSPRSQYVRVTWTTNVNDTRPVASDTVKLRVRAGASVRGPRVVRAGRTFTVRGRLKGDKPSAAVKVGLDGYERGRYRPGTPLRAVGKDGRFTLRYAFQGSRGRTFRLRVRIVSGAGWPYTDGSSRSFRVRVR